MYRLIAFDMDGTLLNSYKQISIENKKAITKAAGEGKVVVLNTGRCLAELDEYLLEIPEVRYLNCASGALVYDLKERKIIYSKLLDILTVKKLLDFAILEKAMPQIMLEKSIVQEDNLKEMELYGMAEYKTLFGRITEKWKDIVQEYERNAFEAAKVNIYHRNPESRRNTKDRIIKSGVDVTMVQAEHTGLEISARGVNKGSGLEKLCQYIGMSISQCIVVGDADNDVEALRKAGFAIAMGNANATVKRIADVVVADCDRDGCAEAIGKYLLDIC